MLPRQPVRLLFDALGSHLRGRLPYTGHGPVQRRRVDDGGEQERDAHWNRDPVHLRRLPEISDSLSSTTQTAERGKGFDDTTTPGDNVFFTFSRVLEPRLELLPEHTDALAIFGSNRRVKDMAFAYDVRNDDWPDMFAGPSKDGHPLLARQSQQVANLLGATKNLFGRSAYVLPAQWNLDPMPYRVLMIEPFRETTTGHTTLCTKTNDELDGTVALGDWTSNANVFMKIPIPSAYNVPGPQARQLQLSPPVHVEKIESACWTTT